MRIFSTLLGMIETDAFCAWKHFHVGAEKDEHVDFTESVALALLTNKLNEAGTDTRTGGSPEKRGTPKTQHFSGT